MGSDRLRDVPDRVLEAATECEHALACLQDESYPLCRVVSKIATGVLATYCPQGAPCTYCQPAIKSEGFCVCPVRIELYERYRV